GYEVRALNYILKPYKPRRIREVLEEALNALSKDSENTYYIETRDGAYKLSLKNVLYFMSDKRKIIAVTKEGSREFYGKLDELQEKLPPYFVRCHRRYLLNIHHVTAVEKDKADLGIQELPVSRSHYQELMIAFAKNMLEQ
ncbi:MAG: LytTR family DNA-binding domain-containing protein, partial [Bacillota bacterium]|nr:LytTR family DNA-binding domain-containing protein [Bacillota bacterium]